MRQYTFMTREYDFVIIFIWQKLEFGEKHNHSINSPYTLFRHTLWQTELWDWYVSGCKWMMKWWSWGLMKLIVQMKLRVGQYHRSGSLWGWSLAPEKKKLKVRDSYNVLIPNSNPRGQAGYWNINLLNWCAIFA